MRPLLLPPNQPPHFYRGGAAIADLRGLPPGAERAPEDWVGSTTTRFGSADVGLTRLPDGTALKAAIEAQPDDYLGPAHTATFGADPGLLVKLLDAGQRLPVHCHPSREFAARHLGCRYGKTEAWIVVGTSTDEPIVHLGFRRDLDRETVDAWVRTQDTGQLLGAMHPFTVRPGDSVFVPAGVPHAIGAGVFLIELQEPTDFSVMLEWEGFPLDATEGHLGLGYETALSCLDRSGLGADRLADLRRNTAERYADPVVSLLPPEADEFFRAQRIRPGGDVVTLEPSFAVLVGLAGQATLTTEASDVVPIQRGDTLLVPYSAGKIEISGGVDLVRCLPPATSAEWR
jgi:mannose-6-phosphate isomerase